MSRILEKTGYSDGPNELAHKYREEGDYLSMLSLASTFGIPLDAVEQFWNSTDRVIL